MLSRRDMLRGPAVGATLAAGFARQAAAEGDPWAPLPEHVTLEYDQAVLKQYRPKLVTNHLDIKPSALYAWHATSTEYDRNICCYWAWYVTQDSAVSAASHYGDREPVQVHYNPDTGAVELVVVDGYHYYAARYLPDALAFVDETRPKLRVQKPYHFYTAAPSDASGSDVTLDDMTTQYDDWMQNGWEASRRAVLIPWLMASQRQHWWSDQSRMAQFQQLKYGVYLTAGFAGAEDADTGALATDTGFW